MNAARDYMPEPETPREKARAARLLRQSHGPGLVVHGGYKATESFYDDRAVLEFEALWAKPSGNKEQAITQTFNVRPARYHQRLHQIIHDREETARQIDAPLVNRLLKLEASRAGRRHYLPERYTAP